MAFTCSRIVGLVAVTLLVLLSTSAQMGAPSSAALLEGSVVNKVTGSPVRHAHVMYIKVPGANSMPISTDTDSDGHFSVSVEAGSYRLWVERPGFARQTYGSRTPEGAGTVLNLAPGQQLRDIHLQIVPLGAISGHVLDEDGEALQGTGIQVLRYSFATGRRQLITVTGTSSNDLGEYRVYDLPAGRYFLMAIPHGAPLTHAPEGGTLIPELQQSFAAVYYPGNLDFSSASEITLPEGAQVSDADFHLQRVPAVMVRGRAFSAVEDFTGSQLQVVLARNDGNLASAINRTSATIEPNTGKFEFHGIAPGSYLLVASEVRNGHASGGRVPIEVNADTAQQNASVTLTPAFDLSGSVEVEGNSNAKVSGVSIRLSAPEGLALGPPPSAKTGPDGAFRLSGVTPGVWDFTLGPLPENLWIKSANFGNADALAGELNISSGSRGVLRIVLAANGAEVSGAVTQDGQPSHATVVLVPAASELQGSAPMYRSTTTQDGGTFVLRGVRPGAYKLFAFEEVESFAWLDPEFLKPVESLGESISVGEGEKITRQLTPVPPDALLPGR